MADSKVSALTTLASPSGVDLILIIDDPNGTPVSKKISLNSLFGAIASNTVISAKLSVSGNTDFTGSNTTISANTNFTGALGPRITSGFITLTVPTTVSSNNATTVLGDPNRQGSIFWDVDYLYVATSNTQVKRISLSSFS